MKNKTSLAGTTIRVEKSGLITIKQGADDSRPIELVHLGEENYRTHWRYYCKLGIAYGHELLYCVHLGLKHCPDFLRRAVAYRVVSRKQKTVRCEVVKSDRSSEFVDRQIDALKVIFYETRAGRKSSRK